MKTKSFLFILLFFLFISIGYSSIVNHESLSPLSVFSHQAKGLSADDLKGWIKSITRMNQNRSFDDIKDAHAIPLFDPLFLESLHLINPDKQFEVLDIGAGKGVFLRELVKKTSEYKDIFGKSNANFDMTYVPFGYEIQEMESKILEEEKKYSQNHPLINWQFGQSAEQLPKNWENKFSVVLATRVFEYIYDPLQAIQEAYRVLKVGGKASIAISILNKKEYEGLKDNCMSDDWREKDKTVGHVYFEGINMFKEVRRLQMMGYDIALQVPYYDRGWKLHSLTEKEEAMFLDGKEFPYPHFVLVMKKNVNRPDLKFNHSLKKLDYPIHRQYTSNVKEIPQKNNKSVKMAV